MSYPSQPQFTPPYGQPPQRQGGNNLWMIGGTVIAVLAVIMTVVLVLVQQNAGSQNQAGGGGQTEDTQESEPTGEETGEQEPTEEEPTEEEPTSDDSGSTGDPAGFDESTCDAFDLGPFEDLFGVPAEHPDDTDVTAESTYLMCYYTSADYDSLKVSVTSYTDADSVMETHEYNREYWEDHEDYEVTDYTEVGDAGFHSVFGSAGSQLRELEFVIGKLMFSIEIWIYTDKHDADLTDETLTDYAEQAEAFFTQYS